MSAGVQKSLSRRSFLSYGAAGLLAATVRPGLASASMSIRAVDRLVAKTGKEPEDARALIENMSPQHRLMEAVEVAHIVASLLPNDARGVHGQVIAIDGGRTGG